MFAGSRPSQRLGPFDVRSLISARGGVKTSTLEPTAPNASNRHLCRSRKTEIDSLRCRHSTPLRNSSLRDRSARQELGDSRHPLPAGAWDRGPVSGHDWRPSGKRRDGLETCREGPRGTGGSAIAFVLVIRSGILVCAERGLEVSDLGVFGEEGGFEVGGGEGVGAVFVGLL